MTEPGGPARRSRAAALPWLLWAVTLVAVAVGSFLTIDELDERALEEEAALLAADQAAVRARAALASAAALQEKLDAATTERDAQQHRADELAATLADRDAELARLAAAHGPGQKAAAPAAPAAPAATKGRAVEPPAQAKGRPTEAPARPKDGKPAKPASGKGGK